MKVVYAVLGSLAAFAAFAQPIAKGENWVAAWSGAPQLTEPRNMPPKPGFADATVRQIVRLSIGGSQIRLHFSNGYGKAPLTIESVFIARPAGPGVIAPDSNVPANFGGKDSVTIQPGQEVVSDPIAYSSIGASEVMVSLHTKDATQAITGHPGSRCTTFFSLGNHATEASLPDAVQTQHWYYLCSIDVMTKRASSCVAIIGDSITDGRGSTTEKNHRWPDFLVDRIRSDAKMGSVAVINQGIGGNRVLNDGLGPSVLARFNRDALTQPGIKWIVVFEGINDLGTKFSASGPDPKLEHIADDLIAAYAKCILQAHAHKLKIFGATITACGESFYFSPELEAARQKVNAWVRAKGHFDAVIDFDAATRDEATPTRLKAAVDSGDHLHLNDTGYQVIANAIDLGLFQ